MTDKYLTKHCGWFRLASMIGIAVIAGIICLVPLELILRSRGYGYPPLYRYDATAGYVLKPCQELIRNNECRVFINSLGMRSQETTKEKPRGIFRIVIFGDSVPYGGSYIDQEDIFSSVAQKELNGSGEQKFEVLNAGINAWGPQNVSRYIRKIAAFNADMVIVYLPWGDLRRGFTTFHVVPFWADTPTLAISEFFRHGVWTVFGVLSRKWKEGSLFNNVEVLEENLTALVETKNYCDSRGIRVFFFWSPDRDVLLRSAPDDFETDRQKLCGHIHSNLIVDMTPVFSSANDVSQLYVDPCHYSREGHRVVGKFLGEFIRSQLGYQE